MSSFKGGLTVSGGSFDKNKAQMRRPTPDSDVLASSDDDRDHVPPARPAANAGLYPGGRRPSSGWLQDIQPTRKFSLPSVSFALPSQPTTPSLELPQQRPTTSAFPWNTSSFTANSSGARFKEISVPSPTSAYPPGEKPLPSPIEVDDSISFLLNQQQSTRKSVRSQSYSVGQGDVDNPAAHLRSKVRGSAVRHRPSKPSLLSESAVALTQLREDDIDEVESSNGSEQGVRLPPGYWEREQKQALLKQAAMENARARNRATSTGSPILQPHRKAPSPKITRRFSENVGTVDEADLMDVPMQTQWATGIPPLGMDAVARRHSFAHYGAHHPTFPLSTLGHTQEEDEDETVHQSESPPIEEFDAAAYFTGFGPASRAINASAISAAHPDPIPSHNMPTPNPYAVPTIMGRPGRRLFVVVFKCSRADIYYLYDNTGLEIRRGDLVIVEGDRGADLGQVTHADVTLEDAKKHKAEANEEHFRWLVMFSQYSLAGTANDSGMLGALARAHGLPNTNRAQLTSMGAQQEQDAKPKMIKRLAQQHEIMGLRDKEGQEAKAKRVGAQKAAEHKLPMEILDAEYQADYHKLTYFYYADAYVNFNDLVTDLFKQYKVRIWMSAVNPASVVNPAGVMQVPPPSAIGPGAIIHSNAANATLSVGPGFGNSSYRAAEQYGRGRTNAGQAAYEETYYPFSHQLPNFAPSYPLQQWGQPQPDMYGRYGDPNVNASGSPMNFPAWYPPTTFASTSPAFSGASSGPAYRGGSGYAPTTAASMAGSRYGPYTTLGESSSAYSTAPAHSSAPFPNTFTTAPSHGSQYRTGFETAAGYGGSFADNSGLSTSAIYDTAFITAMQNLNFTK